jgi:enterochelin esterase-like enzyme
MFSLFRPDSAQIEDLETRINELEAEVERRIKNDEDRLLQMYKNSASQPVAIDFDSLNVFSIERVVKLNIQGTHLQPATIVGYHNTTTTDRNGEWYLYCSDEEHAKLVEDFKKYLKAKR